MNNIFEMTIMCFIVVIFILLSAYCIIANRHNLKSIRDEKLSLYFEKAGIDVSPSLNLSRIFETFPMLSKKETIKRCNELLNILLIDSFDSSLEDNDYVYIKNMNKSYHVDDKKDIIKIYGLQTNTFDKMKSYKKSILSSSNLLAIDPNNVNSLLSRVEAYIILEKYLESAKDIDTIISINGLRNDSTTIDLILKRANSRFKMYDMAKAKDDFVYVYENTKNIKPNIEILNNLAICQKYMGQFSNAAKSLNTIIDNSKNVEIQKIRSVYTELHYVYKEMADYRNALKILNKLIDSNPYDLVSIYEKAVIFAASGFDDEAIKYFKQCISMDSKSEAIVFAYVRSLVNEGLYFEAASWYDKLVKIPDKSAHNYKREVFYYTVYRSRELLNTYNADNEVEAEVKYFSTHPDANELKSGGYISYSKRGKEYKVSKKKQIFIASKEFNQSVGLLLNSTSSYADWCQLNAQGFQPNQRMHAAYGLAVLQMAQALNMHVKSLKTGGLGYLVPDISSSKTFFNGFKSCNKYSSPSNDCPKGFHIFGWRDLIDIFIRWRHGVEHMDFVWWADVMFASQTYGDKKRVITYADTYILHSGVGGNARYQDYRNICLEKVKSMIIKRGYLPATKDKKSKQIKKLPKEKVESVLAADNIIDLVKAVGETFHIQMKLESSLPVKNGKKKKYIDGTKFVLYGGNDIGPNFGIQTPVIIDRIEKYEKEYEFIFESLVSSLVNYDYRTNSTEDADKIIVLGLKLCYYWLNVQEITRGTSVTGYGIVYSTVLMTGHEINEPMPHMKQLDWEAFVSDSPDEFVSRVWPIFKNRRKSDKSLLNLIFGEDEDQTCNNSDTCNEKDQFILVSDLLNTTIVRTYVLANLKEYRPIPQRFKYLIDEEYSDD